MTSPKFLTEATIAGFFYLLATFFVALKVFGVENACIEHNWKGFLPFIAVAVVAASYLLGPCDAEYHSCCATDHILALFPGGIDLRKTCNSSNVWLDNRHAPPTGQKGRGSMSIPSCSWRSNQCDASHPTFSARPPQGCGLSPGPFGNPEHN